MKKFLPLIVLSAFFFLPQSAYAGLSEGCFPIVQCDPGQDFYGGSCQTHIETLTDCGVPPAGKFNAFTCDAGCYEKNVSVPAATPVCPGGVQINGICLVKLNILDDTVDAYSVGNGAFKIWDGAALTEVVHVGNAGCVNNQIAVSDSTSATGWKCADTVPGFWLKSGTDLYYSGGNVGVKTAAPAYDLDVNGRANAKEFCIAGVCISGWKSAGLWSLNGTSVYYNGGNVGIGTSTPTVTNKLEVVGKTASTEFCLAGVCISSWPVKDTGRYIGLSATAVNGNRTNYTTANDQCKLGAGALAGSHICTSMEMIATYNNDPAAIGALNEIVWINHGPPGYVSNVANDCNGWKSSSSTIFGYVWDGVIDSAYIVSCNEAIKIACCK